MKTNYEIEKNLKAVDTRIEKHWSGKPRINKLQDSNKQNTLEIANNQIFFSS